MTATLVGVIYDSVSGEVLRLVIPDHEDQLVPENFTTEGETLLKIPVMILPDTTDNNAIYKFVNEIVEQVRLSEIK